MTHEMLDELSPYCPYYHRALSVVANRWTLEIVRALLSGASRFSELAAAIPGLSDRLLSERLKTLEAEGIVTRNVVPAIPVRVEYRLTPKGFDLRNSVAAISSWADRWVTLDRAEAAG